MNLQTRDKCRNHSSEPELLVRAAQYVRMSTEDQQFSIDNQKAAIQDYADRHRFLIVKTYADAGKSGVIARNRPALRELLKDVVGGNSGYKAILVYDVSRWGRFPNSDEAAYYEFLCSRSGIPLHYCAESFTNDSTVSSSLLKALKRSMAAEFSRELGEKVFRGKTRIVQLGFWVGGPAGYGYRRLMVSAEGKRKQVLKWGEHKSLTTDRVILVLGPRLEVKRVREMFSMALDGLGCTAIARELNRSGKFKSSGKAWYSRDIYNIVTNPKYAGCNVWYRRTQRLRETRLAVEPQHWISKPAAFAAIIDLETFDRTQAAMPRRSDSLWSDEEILKKLRRLLASKGYLSESLILRTRGMPATSTLHKHFGNYRQLYEAVGYQLPPYDLYRGEPAEPSMRLRRKLVKQLGEIFPEHVRVTSLPKSDRSILEVDHSFIASVLLCASYQRAGKQRLWVVHRQNAAERDHITLLCKVSPGKHRIVSYHLVPRVDVPGRTHKTRLYDDDPLLQMGIPLKTLSGFYAAAKTLRLRQGVTDLSASP
ncbi:MAG: recombinase family protein [Candidatus Korobacteraceae bacterium]